MTLRAALQGVLDRFEQEFQILTDGEHGDTSTFPEVAEAVRLLSQKPRPLIDRVATRAAIVAFRGREANVERRLSRGQIEQLVKAALITYEEER